MDKETERRIAALVPGGVPRYVRCYDNEGASFDRYTIILTGKRGGGFYRGCSENPYHPQGFGISDTTRSGQPLDIEIQRTRLGRLDARWAPAIGRSCPVLGKRLAIGDLPPMVQVSVWQDYCEVWDLPYPQEQITSLRKQAGYEK